MCSSSDEPAENNTMELSRAKSWGAKMYDLKKKEYNLTLFAWKWSWWRLKNVCSKNFHNIVAAFRGMHVSPAKHSYAWLPRKCDYRTERRTDRQVPDKVIPMCRYAWQATQKETCHRKLQHVLRWGLTKVTSFYMYPYGNAFFTKAECKKIVLCF